MGQKMAISHQSASEQHRGGIGGTSVVATLARGAGRRAISICADMDALPIAEETGLDYTENSIVHHGQPDDEVRLISKPFRRHQLAVKVAAALGTSEAPARRPRTW